ncbi:Dynein heavy chain AAA module D4 [Trinorchestia longiramus]|nr:Dynein heavy chain AAA module D4 [Trinorchestia longiramus]
MKRSIKDVNQPKFLAHDLPLFEGIISDLFRDVVLPEPDYSNLHRAIKEACSEMGLRINDYFVGKIQQIYETMKVRHGFMIVGNPIGGKSCGLRVLAKALASMNARDEGEEKVQVGVINPKSVTLGQLYGQFDPVTHEWSDGVLAVLFRKFAMSSSSDRKWLVLDGPVDSVWIENINSVLDDNKKLCLMSGEIICLSSTTNIIFEVEHLEKASPATVSRCGMVYMEPMALGWKPLVESWLANLPQTLTNTHKAVLTALFHRFVPPLLAFVRRHLLWFKLERSESYIEKDVSPTTDLNLVRSLMNLFDCFKGEFEDPAYTKHHPETDIRAHLESIFLFSVIWSLGGALNEPSRALFDVLLRELFQGPPSEESTKKYGLSKVIDPPHEYQLPIPDEGTVFDYRFVKEGRGYWQKWSEDLANASSIPRDAAPHEILVPTVETVRMSALLQLLLTQSAVPLLVVGPPATGKTMYITVSGMTMYITVSGMTMYITVSGMTMYITVSGKTMYITVSGMTMYITNFLMNRLKSDAFKPLQLSFSAHSTTSHVQELVMGALDKRKKGKATRVFGPPIGKKCVMFVDDLNLPQADIHGAYPPLELLRQMLDYATWYDVKKEVNALRLEDIQLVCAMTIRETARLALPPRLLRHFNVIAINEFTDHNIRTIYSKILLWHLDTRGFSKMFDACIEEMVTGSLAVYRAAIANLLPTPSRSHYIFNLRDFFRIVQGLLLSVPETMEEVSCMKTLWVHETMRVFSDRLVDSKDRQWLLNQTADACSRHLHQDFHELLQHLDQDHDGIVTENDLRSLLYCDFADPKCETRQYVPVTDLEALRGVVEGYLSEFNNMSKKPMSLVMFKFALEHLGRISRVMRQPRGHALLVGVGGSGRHSLTRLAAHIADYELIEIEMSRTYGITEWRDDLKMLVKKAGFGEQPVVFLFSDTQVKQEVFLEGVCSLLSSGEVPGLFPSDEKHTICDKMRNFDRQRDKSKQTDGSTMALWQLFVSRVREQLHVVLAMSPCGDPFRNRLRRFPALLSCCTLDWFQPWPEDALQAVAVRLLKEVELPDDTRQGCVALCQLFHTSTQALSERYIEEMGRFNYVTPTSYLQLLHTYMVILQKKREEVKRQESRYTTGLDRLEEAASSVGAMQQELINLQPILLKKTKEVEDKMAMVEKRRGEVAEVERVVRQDEEVANQAAGEANKIRLECEAELNKALPLLEEATVALNTIKQDDIVFIKAMKNPPSGVKLVMEAICVLLGEKPDRIPDPLGTGKMVEEYWSVSKRMLGDIKFKENLLNFDKEHISPKAIQIIRTRYRDNEEFKPEKIKVASKASESLCKWVLAMERFEEVDHKVAPKREALRKADKDYQSLMAELRKKQDALRGVQEELAGLQAELDTVKKEKMELEQTVELCNIKKERAEQLLSALGGEKSRWTENARQLARMYINLTGDVLLASGSIAYLGAFTPEYRTQQTAVWVTECRSHNVPCSSTFDLSSILGDPLTIRDWTLNGLPTDAFSIDNGVIISNTTRWPLLIDPQGQANKWIRNMEKDNSLQVLKLSDPDFIRALENCVQYGQPVLLENVSEELDPILEPLLLKQTFKQSGSTCIKLGDSTIEYSPEFRCLLLECVPPPRVCASPSSVCLPLECVPPPRVCASPSSVCLHVTRVSSSLSNIYFKTLVSIPYLSLYPLIPSSYPLFPFSYPLSPIPVPYDLFFLLFHEFKEQMMYLTTKLSNPDYVPEVSVKVTLVNFALTAAGLEDQLLALVVTHEKPELEEERVTLMLQTAANKKNLKELEDRILSTLSSSQGSILEDETAIIVLSDAKRLVTETQEKQAVADETEKKINMTRQGYRSIAVHASILFFTLRDLATLDPMYQFSLSWFVNLFSNSIDSSERSSDLEGRLKALTSHFTLSLYRCVCTGLFEKDKLVFSFLMSVNLERAKGSVGEQEWLFLVTGGAAMAGSEVPNPAPQWLQTSTWKQFQMLSMLPAFKSVVEDFPSRVSEWQVVGESPTPHKEALPQTSDPPLSKLQTLCVLRTLRPDKMVAAVLDYVAEVLGKMYIEPPPFDLGRAFVDSSCTIPLIFLLTPGADPTSLILKFAEDQVTNLFGIINNFYDQNKDQGMGGDRLQSVSLGQGQGPFAARLFEEGVRLGTWVLLQNCHLAKSFMPALEKLCEDLNPETTHPDFRLWLTSYPAAHFPVSVLQNGIKMVTEPPEGLKANLKRLYLSDPLCDQEFFSGSGTDSDFRRLVFSLCFFHAVVQERRLFGPLGWNIPYSFSDTDLRISVQQLRNLIAAYSGVPWQAVQYLTAECNYGGKVTDERDRRTLATLLQRFCSHHVLENADYSFDDNGAYSVPTDGALDDYLEHIDSLPRDAPPDVFGMNTNASIAKDQNETTKLFAAVLTTQSSSLCSGGDSSGGGESETLSRTCSDIIDKLPAQFCIDAALRKFPPCHAQSLSTVLVQEMCRYNTLLDVIVSSLTSVRKAIAGSESLTEETEEVLGSIRTGRVPQLWLSKSYPTLKSLGFYVQDLCARLDFLWRWFEDGMPKVFWLSGFFFTQSFLTAVLQNHARKHCISIDELTFRYTVLKETPTEHFVTGAVIDGLYLEGARWCAETGHLEEALPRKLHDAMPPIWLEPVEKSIISSSDTYSCPVYKTSGRRGELTTTGHSTNYILSVDLPTHLSPDHWVLRGVALLCSLAD